MSKFGTQKEIVRDENMRDHDESQRETKQPSVRSESAGLGMPEPKDPGEHHMGGVHKGSMGSAVASLNKQTERGEHAPTVGGHKIDSCR